jgi:hypothetical protein
MGSISFQHQKGSITFPNGKIMLPVTTSSYASATIGCAGTIYSTVVSKITAHDFGIKFLDILKVTTKNAIL